MTIYIPIFHKSNLYEFAVRDSSLILFVNLHENGSNRPERIPIEEVPDEVIKLLCENLSE